MEASLLAPPRAIAEDYDHVVVSHGVAWAQYVALDAARHDSAVPRLTYDRGVLELMSPAANHETRRRARRAAVRPERREAVLSAHASLRVEVVLKKAVVPVAPPAQLPLFDESAQPSAETNTAKAAWVGCGGALRIVKIATRPDDLVLGVLGSLRSVCARSARGGARSRRARFAARTSRGRADREHSRPALQFR